MALRQGALTSEVLDGSLGGMVTPEELEARFTLVTAVARYDALRTRAASAAGAVAEGGAADPEVRPLDREEALESLALGEAIARKAGRGRQLAVRSARATGASWSQ